MSESQGTPVIETRLLNKVYAGAVTFHALHDIQLTIYTGEMVAIMGTSGSGKSTLMNILGCLDRQSSGEYLLDGQDVTALKDHELAHIRNQNWALCFKTLTFCPATRLCRMWSCP